jgi:hypothetical protein
LYCFLKERILSGCGKFSIDNHCNDYNSVHFKGTLPKPNDSKKICVQKLIDVLTVYDKIAVWRKSYIVGTIIILFVYIFSTIEPRLLLALHVLIVCLLYFYNNYMHYHVNRIGAEIGKELLSKILTPNVL